MNFVKFRWWFKESSAPKFMSCLHYLKHIQSYCPLLAHSVWLQPLSLQPLSLGLFDTICFYSKIHWIIWASSRENVSSGIFDQVRFKPAFSATEASWSLDISNITSRDVVLSRQRTTKALIWLRGCASWCAPLLFAYGIRHDLDLTQFSCFHKKCLLCDIYITGHNLIL